MSERCSNCGAELFAGQQFCRSCGAQVRPAGEDAPTRLLPETEPPATTAPLGGRGTDPVRDPRPTGYQQPPPGYRPPAAFQQTAPLAAAPPARRGAWSLALVAVAVVSVLGTLALVFAFRARQQPLVVVKKGVGDEKVAVPPIPPDLPERVREAVEASGAALPVDESDVTVTDDETTFTKSYPVNPASSFAVNTVNGDVTVEGWDQPAAEVTVVKSGGDAGARAATRVLVSKGRERLALSAAPAAADVSVSYRVRVPRATKHVEVNVDRGEVEVSGLRGSVVVDVKTGGATFGELAGTVRGKLIKGDMVINYGASPKDEPQEFSVVRGNVKVVLGPRPANADLKAETVDGDIEVDEGVVPLRVVRTEVGGRHVAGRLNEGGAPLLIKVVNGDIELGN
ncbi:MAG TPA: zinc ribbon domain-containing protein [Pyrinomonadaceae bacterium]|nr:zinc ribbon domain-containing protein [Pyrinomonadaceae bacterium]